jgi:hypothetical protein
MSEWGVGATHIILTVVWPFQFKSKGHVWPAHANLMQALLFLRCINFDKKILGYVSGDIFHKLIWSPWGPFLASPLAPRGELGP